MTLLITGGDGRLSREALPHLLEDFPSIRCVDVLASAPWPPGVEFRQGDLRDVAFVESLMDGVEAVLHLAPVSPPAWEDAERLDHAARGTFNLANAAAKAGVRGIVLGSALSLFNRFPRNWKIDAEWRPRPTPEVEQLGPWLAELSVRECTRVLPLQTRCLRFGDTDEDEAVSAIRSALSHLREKQNGPGWGITHVASPVGRGGETFPTLQPIPSRPIRKVVIFGAGGPVAAALAPELASSYVLRLTDARPLEEIASGPPQSTGAPLPVPLDVPHERRVVDVRNPDEVMAVCEGMDAIINCSVVRENPADAFRVNTLGAYHIARAAVTHRIRRVVQTGPQLVLGSSADYRDDYDVGADAPPRPGNSLYGHSKYLGQEALRVFAEAYGLEVPVLLFCGFANPETASGGIHPFTVSWQDSARAIRRAMEVRALPSPYEVFNVLADLPHGRFSNCKAKLLLDWEPRDRFERLWSDSE